MHRFNGSMHIKTIQPSRTSNKTCIESTTSTACPCQRTVVALSEALLKTQNELSELRNANTILSEIVEYNVHTARKLIIGGNISKEDDPVTTVQFLLREKIGFSCLIVSAVRNKDYSITFEVPTLKEKVRIIEQAKEKLRNSKFFYIKYPSI